MPALSCERIRDEEGNWVELKANLDFDPYYNSIANRMAFRWVDIAKRRIVRDHLGRTQGLKILDLGCGAGEVSRVLCGGNRVYGVDVNEALLARARANGLETSVGDFSKIPFDSGFFDAVIMIDTIEHVESRSDAMNEILRVLGPDGQWLGITPAYNSPLWNLGEYVGHFISRQRAGHISPFIYESFEYFLRKYFYHSRVGYLNFSMWLYGFGQKPKSTV
jgi:ubiquinone/menaquinone biosynthesis C-methylase UbiE